jgi:hypothetical protein
MISKFINDVIYGNSIAIGNAIDCNNVNCDNKNIQNTNSKMDIDKRVIINENENKIHYTYSENEYNREQIISLITFRRIGLLSNEELNNIFHELNYYKKYEMPIHTDSINNTKFHRFF